MAIAEQPVLETKISEATVARFPSVDALRGFDMFWIMGGDLVVHSFQKIHDSVITRGLAEQMEHCKWDGFRFYDLIFPLFVFIAGVSIPFSIPKIIERQGKMAAVKRVALRSVILFVLGILYMGGVERGLENVYLAGVLQRIAVAYFFAALLFCFYGMRTLVGLTLVLLVGYWALMTFIPVPGIGPASYEQGKNLAYYLDQRFLPGQKFEGTLLSTMSAVANCIFGIFAGLLLKNKNFSEQKKVFCLAGAGGTGLLLGYLWSLQFPIIKLLWTSTYVLVACGYGALLLALFHQIIEVWKYQKWAQPFVWIGMNAITVYLVSSIARFRKLADRFVGGDIRMAFGDYADLVQASVVLAFVFLFVHFLYRRKIFLRL